MGTLITEYSLWYLPLCILLAGGYAWLLYSAKSPWSKRWNYGLAALRFTLVSLLLFLLLGPLLKHIRTTQENPIVVLAIDDSKSIDFGNSKAQQQQWLQDLRKLREALSARSIDWQQRSLSGKNNQLDSLNPEHPFTSLSDLLKITQNDFENQNVAGILVLSDGIINQGSDPSWQTYRYPIHGIGVGDTVAKKDILIKSLLYNKLTYKNSTFPIVAEIQQQGFGNQTVQVQLWNGDKLLATNLLALQGKESLQRSEFRATATETGLLHYRVEVKPLPGEYTTRNNVSHAYLEVLENKEKILILAAAPHPDIKAIRAALEKKENYEVSLHIPGIHTWKEESFDLVIFHQFPDAYGQAKNLLDKFIQQETSIFFILGGQSNLSAFNNLNKVIQLQTRGAQKDLVTAAFNDNFLRYSMDGNQKALFKDLPPLQIPYGEYSLKEGTDVILYQRIGTVTSNRPLLAINTLYRQAVLAGEGLWQWRYHEYVLNEQQEAVDQLLAQTAQLLSGKNDKRKFRIQTTQQEYGLGESVVFEAELYNDLYQPIYGNRIGLEIRNEKNEKTSYEFAVGESNNRFDVNGLGEGIYRYTASTQLNGKTESANGQFIVKASQLEAIQTTADHFLLRNLAEKNGGTFVRSDRIAALEQAILASDPKPILHSQEELTEAMELPWLFWILLSLAVTEWAVRKYKGSY
ncbi:MAG: VWA domain-containing protein [Cytophagaceae bacterium]|jgi:hypothetical protein|nr:VWA domain-containing protein [Cytophagaceae bacterium]